MHPRLRTTTKRPQRPKRHRAQHLSCRRPSHCSPAEISAVASWSQFRPASETHADALGAFPNHRSLAPYPREGVRELKRVWQPVGICNQHHRAAPRHVGDPAGQAPHVAEHNHRWPTYRLSGLFPIHGILHAVEWRGARAMLRLNRWRKSASPQAGQEFNNHSTRLDI